MLFSPSVRPSVTAYLENHIFAQSYIITRLKNVQSGFLKKVLAFSHFSKRHIGICYNLVRKLGHFPWTIFGNVMCGKFLFWLFWPIYGKKCIACGDKILFLAVFCPFPFVPIFRCSMAMFCFLDNNYGFFMEKENKKIVKVWPVFVPFLDNNWPFLHKNQVFGHFFSN